MRSFTCKKKRKKVTGLKPFYIPTQGLTAGRLTCSDPRVPSGHLGVQLVLLDSILAANNPWVLCLRRNKQLHQQLYRNPNKSADQLWLSQIIIKPNYNKIKENGK